MNCKKRRRLVGLPSPIGRKGRSCMRFIRELEQGKVTMRLDKVNQVLKLFGHELGAVLQPEILIRKMINYL